MTKNVNFTLCDTFSGEVLGSSHKVMAVNDTPEFEKRCVTWLQSFFRGVKQDRNITIQISVEDFKIPVQQSLF